MFSNLFTNSASITLPFTFQILTALHISVHFFPFALQHISLKHISAITHLSCYFPGYQEFTTTRSCQLNNQFNTWSCKLQWLRSCCVCSWAIPMKSCSILDTSKENNRGQLATSAVLSECWYWWVTRISWLFGPPALQKLRVLYNVYLILCGSIV